MSVSVLLYGPEGSGKTALALSSFVDWRTGELRPGRVGRYIVVGREGNPALRVPEECVKRFTVNPDKPMSFVEPLNDYLRTLVAGVRKGNLLTDVVFDSWTEYCTAYLWSHQQSKKGGESWDSYRDWLTEFNTASMLLNKDTLNANVFGIAGVDEFRKTSKTRGGNEVKGDPEYMEDFAYMPGLSGKARYRVGHHFNFVVYMEEDYRAVKEGNKTLKLPVKKSHWLPTGSYRVKNVLDWCWPLEQAVLENASWADVEAIMEGLTKGEHAI